MPHPTHKDSKEAILENKNGFFYLEDFVYHKESVKEAMSDYAELISIEHLNWVIDTFTTDEGRLPISSNTKLGGKTIFINHEEYPLSHTFQLFLKSKQQSQQSK